MTRRVIVSTARSRVRVDAEPDAARGLDVQLAAGLVEQDHRAAGDLVAALEQLDERVQDGLQAQRARQRLADLEQRREPADLVGVVPGLTFVLAIVAVITPL